MIKQKILLATLLMAIFLCIAPAASHAGTSSFKGMGGGVWLNNKVKDYDLKYNTGFVYGASYGTTWFCYLKTEIEIFRLHCTSKGFKADAKPAKITGTIDNYAALFNVAVECPFSLSKVELRPYLGGGLGICLDKSKLHLNTFQILKKAERHFSYQYFGGISFPIIPLIIGEISASVEGRYYVFDKHFRAVMAVGGIALKF